MNFLVIMSDEHRKDAMGCVGHKLVKTPNLDKLANQQDNPDRTVLSEYHDAGSTTGAFMIRWDKWKFVYYVDQVSQLFDLDNDPHELNDLSSDQSYKDILAEAEKRLRTICDPEQANRDCFSDQQKRIEELGGLEACKNSFVFNHTPIPNTTT